MSIEIIIVYLNLVYDVAGKGCEGLGLDFGHFVGSWCKKKSTCLQPLYFCWFFYQKH